MLSSEEQIKSPQIEGQKEKEEEEKKDKAINDIKISIDYKINQNKGEKVTEDDKKINLELKSFDSDKKLEKKIKDLERKLDKLNNPSPSEEDKQHEEEKK